MTCLPGSSLCCGCCASITARYSPRCNCWNMCGGLDFDPGSNVVNVYIRYLRPKLGADAIETIRGMGYRLVT